MAGMEAIRIDTTAKGLNALKKLRALKDIHLLWRLFLSSVRLLFISRVKGYQAALRSVSSISLKSEKRQKAEDVKKISNYVGTLVLFRRKLGFKETCLTHSLLLCRTLRANGVDARINFGARKIGEQTGDGSQFTGHCWVTVHNQKSLADYELLFTYPEN
jgi:hypothetical protein